jgi:hypothetical protein
VTAPRDRDPHTASARAELIDPQQAAAALPARHRITRRAWLPSIPLPADAEDYQPNPYDQQLAES